MSKNQQVLELLDLISDPILGPFEGEDFCIDSDGIIQVSDNNVRMAALIMRKANTSGKFTEHLVKVGHRGDTILLGFDSLFSTDNVYTNQIGFKNDTLAEVKKDPDQDHYYVYLNGKRSIKQFKSLGKAKGFIKKLDRDLQTVGNLIIADDDIDD